uniref:DEP domain-containing protein n=1 Tax=Ascaris lumbricoides TaxID=6252 RepID=A0A0M3I674_ASCLU
LQTISIVDLKTPIEQSVWTYLTKAFAVITNGRSNGPVENMSKKSDSSQRKMLDFFNERDITMMPARNAKQIYKLIAKKLLERGYMNSEQMGRFILLRFDDDNADVCCTYYTNVDDFTDQPLQSHTPFREILNTKGGFWNFMKYPFSMKFNYNIRIIARESTVDDSSSYDSGGSAQQGLPAGFNEFVDYAPQTDDSMMGQWNMYSSVWSFSQAPNAGPSHNVVPYQQPSFYRYGGVGLPDERLSPSCSVPTRCTSTTSDAASTFSIVNDEKKNVRMESIERYGFSGRHITDTFGAMGKDENKNEVSELLVLNHHHLEMKRVAQTNKVTDCCT